ncbi:MAG: PLDc N-terminal domain-containing protein [Nanoarchaeota archaeon]
MVMGLLALGVFGVLLVLLAVAIAIWAFVFWILMIVDCATRKFKDSTERVVWIIVIVFLHIIGALIYYFVVKRNNKH